MAGEGERKEIITKDEAKEEFKLLLKLTQDTRRKISCFSSYSFQKILIPSSDTFQLRSLVQKSCLINFFFSSDQTTL
jgi:hypothetical protein